jgi:hypothetical protein
MSDRFSIETAIAGRRGLLGFEIAPLGGFQWGLGNSQNGELAHFEIRSVLSGGIVRESFMFQRRGSRNINFTN